MINENEKTVCNPLVGASGRQSIQSTEISIPQTVRNCNSKFLETKSMAEIYDTVYLSKPGRLFKDYNIRYANRRTHDGRKVYLWKE